ncbi:Bet v I domain-containing protein [Artemisia annua]|uniref:Bet v I domain-containing protein n=1 Tax=Artemisia annua TaxID=35608 RepID=A0A2U1P630_ARTAN|nr:Bet v I domain-containing protein [Artemisia annua]
MDELMVSLCTPPQTCDGVSVWGWMMLNKLPSRLNLHQRGIDVRLVLCPICQDDVESVNDIFYNCAVAKDLDLWDLLANSWDLDPVCANISEWYSWLDSLHVSVKVRLFLGWVIPFYGLYGAFVTVWFSLILLLRRRCFEILLFLNLSVNPSLFKSIETVEGNGGVGTIKLVTFGDAVPFTTGKYKVDIFDASNFTYGHTFYEGDILMGIANSIIHHVTITSSADGGSGGSVYKQTVTYNCIGENKPSEEALNFEKAEAEKTFKAIEAYAAAQS